MSTKMIQRKTSEIQQKRSVLIWKIFQEKNTSFSVTASIFSISHKHFTRTSFMANSLGLIPDLSPNNNPPVPNSLSKKWG